MIKLTKTLTAMLAAAALTLTGLGVADATTLPATMGAAQDPTKVACFRSDITGGFVTNFSTSASCQFNNLWFIGMPNDTFNLNKNAAFTMRATSLANGTNCRIRARSRDQLVTASSTFAQVTAINTWQTFVTSTISVPSNSYLYADCSIPQNSSVSVVTYTP
jgi:hypothetical protein